MLYTKVVTFPSFFLLHIQTKKRPLQKKCPTRFQWVTTLCNNAIESPIASMPHDTLQKCCKQRCLAQCSYLYRNSAKSAKYDQIIGKTCADMCQYIEYQQDHNCRQSADAPFTLPPSMRYNDHNYADHAGVTFPTFNSKEIQNLKQNASVHPPVQQNGVLDRKTRLEIAMIR